VAAALSGGVVSLFDAERATTACVSAVTRNDRLARDGRGESPAIFSVDGGGGMGKTTLLLLVAHDRRVRRKIHHILFLGVGKDATEAKSSPTLLILWTLPVLEPLPQGFARFPLVGSICRKL
jgi:hypothetical protein